VLHGKRLNTPNIDVIKLINNKKSPCLYIYLLIHLIWFDLKGEKKKLAKKSEWVQIFICDPGPQKSK